MQSTSRKNNTAKVSIGNGALLFVVKRKHVLSQWLLASTALLGLGLSTGSATAQQTDWTSGTGNWNDVGHWTAGVPDASSIANLDLPGIVATINGGTRAAADQVWINAGGGLVVSGAGTRLDVGNSVNLGVTSTGSVNAMTIEGGAAVTATSVYVGGGAGDGLLTVTGANSTLTINAGGSQAFVVGGSAGSELVIANDGSVSLGTAILDLGDGATTGKLSIGNGGTTGTLYASQVRTNNAASGVVFDATNDSSFSPVISGSGYVTKDGTNKVSLSGMNTYTGATTINSGTLALVGQGRLNASSGVTVNSGATFDISDAQAGGQIQALFGSGAVELGDKGLQISNASGKFSGVISGQGGIGITGGTQILDGENLFAGSVGLSVGTTLQIGDGGSTGSIVADVLNFGQLTFDRADDVEYAGKITGTGAFSQVGAGKLTLTATNSTSGAVTIANGSTLQLGNGGTVGWIGGTNFLGSITNNGALIYDRSNNVSYAGIISGSGSVTQAGSGKLTLAGANTYAGGTTIAGGVLQVSSDANLGAAAGGITLDNGTLQTTAAFTSNRDVIVTAAGGTIQTDADLVENGDITGPGLLTKKGSADLTLGGAISIGAIEVREGTLNLQNNVIDLTSVGAFGISTNALSTAIHATNVNVSGSRDLFDALGGGTITIDGGTLTTSGASSNGSAAAYAQFGTLGLNGVTVATSEANAYGVRTDDLGHVTIAGSHITTAGDRAFGVVGYELFSDRPYSIAATGSSVETSGAQAYGLYLRNDREAPTDGNPVVDGQATFSSGSIVTHGAGAAGVYVLDASLTLNDSTIHAEQGPGFQIATGGSVAASGGSIESGQATAIVNLSGSKDGKITLSNEAEALINDGRLFEVSRAGGATGIASLVLDSGSVAQGSIIDQAPGTGATNLEINQQVHFSGSVQGVNQVSLNGGTWSLAGLQDFKALDVDSGGGTLDIGLAGAELSVPFAGAGNVTKAGAGTLALTGDSSAFAGSTTVAAGTLSVNGSVGGAMDVLDGGRLQGNGTIGDTTIASGGIIAPGNSPGTLHVNGDLLLSPRSIYDAEILGNGMSDLIDVTGTATIIGSHLQISALDPETSYKQGQTYTLLTAAGGINGTFADVISRSAFLDFSVDRMSNEIDLNIDQKNNPTDPTDPGTPPLFATVADTHNQKATAGALDTLAQSGASLALYNDLLLLDAASARSAFDGLSGEVHASLKTGLVDDSRFIRDAANERLRAAFDGVATDKAAPVLAYGPDGAKQLAPSDTARFAAWGSAFGSWSSYDGNGNAAGLDTSTGGFVTGLDGLIAESWRLGLLAGYSHSSFHVDGRESSAASDNYHLGVYGGTTWNKLSFRSGLAYSWHSIDTSRQVGFPGFADQLSGDYDAGTFQAFGEVGYRIDMAHAAFEPFANLAHVRLHTDGFNEDGGAAALSANSQTTDTTFTTLGLRASSSFTLGGMQTMARGMLGWKHAFGDVTPVSTQAFAGSDAFSVAGVPLAEDSAIVEAGLDVNVSKNATLGIAWQGQFGNGTSQNAVNATFGVRF